MVCVSVEPVASRRCDRAGEGVVGPLLAVALSFSQVARVPDTRSSMWRLPSASLNMNCVTTRPSRGVVTTK